METRPSGKIEAQGLGIAAVSDKLLQQRAQDLAEQDGRTEPTDADRAHALRELRSPIANRAPEVPPGDENLTVWNQSPDMTGHLVPNVLPDDEAGISAELTKEDVEEADQDRRRAAKDEIRPDQIRLPALLSVVAKAGRRRHLENNPRAFEFLRRPQREYVYRGFFSASRGQARIPLSKPSHSPRETNITVAEIHHGGAVAASRITWNHSPRC